MLKQISLLIALSATLIGCGGSDNKKNNSASSVSVVSSSAPASEAASSITASSTPASSTPASSTPASSTPASAAASSVSAANKVLKIDVTSAGTEEWHVQLRQVFPIGLDKTKTYTFTFKVKASETKNIGIAVNLGEDNGYSALPDGNKIDITTDWQTITHTVVPTVDDTSVEFQANLGNNGAFQIWFDDVSFTEQNGTNEQITNGSILDVTDWILGNNVTGVGTLSIETITE